MLAEYEAAAGLLAQLRALGSGPLWPHETATLAVPRPPSERSINTAVSALQMCVVWRQAVQWRRWLPLVAPASREF